MKVTKSLSLSLSFSICIFDRSKERKVENRIIYLSIYLFFFFYFKNTKNRCMHISILYTYLGSLFVTPLHQPRDPLPDKLFLPTHSSVATRLYNQSFKPPLSIMLFVKQDWLGKKHSKHKSICNQNIYNMSLKRSILPTVQIITTIGRITY